MDRWKIFVGICVVVIALCGCGVSEKSEAELQEELVAHKDFFHAQEVQVTDFEIIKRQTNEGDKEDIVYVQVAAENDSISCDLSYCLYYGLYDSGWILDDVSVYDGGVNKITPKEAVGQATAEVLMDVGVQQNYTLVEKTEKPEQGVCSYTFGYNSEDGLEYHTVTINYTFDEKKADWNMAGMERARTILLEPDIELINADMAEQKGEGFVCVEQSGDMQAGTYTFWYERALEERLCITYERYRLEYRFNDGTRSWRQEGHVEEEERKSQWRKDIAGTWVATHREKDSYFSTKKGEDVYYEMVVSNISGDTFSMKLYRAGVLVVEDDACYAGMSYEIVNDNGADIPYRSNIKITGEGFYFYAPIVENVYFTMK